MIVGVADSSSTNEEIPSMSREYNNSESRAKWTTCVLTKNKEAVVLWISPVTGASPEVSIVCRGGIRAHPVSCTDHHLGL